MDALTRLSGDAQTFVDKIWARRSHVHSAPADEFEDVFGLGDADQVITGTALRVPFVRLAKDGTVLPQSTYTRQATIGNVSVTGLVDARKVLRLFDEGATIVFQGLHRYWPPLTQLVRGLEDALGHRCQANAYLTPPGSQGFALHSDTHDVFVFQTYGEKAWEVHDDSGKHSVLMTPGTSMYLPTGTPHLARTQQGASLHVTIGINRYRWRDLLSRAIDPILADPALAEPLPAGYHRDPGAVTEGLRVRLDELSTRLGETDPDEVVASHEASFLSTRQSQLAGGLMDLADLSSVGDTTPVRRRAAATLSLIRADDRLRVLLGDRELRVPIRIEPALEYLQGHPELVPADLAGWLDQESRLVLVRRLVKEGLLEVVR